VIGNFTRHAIVSQSSIGQFHPVLQPHQSEIPFAPGKRSVWRVAARRIRPGLAAALQRKSDRMIVHQVRIAEIVRSFDRVQFVK